MEIKNFIENLSDVLDETDVMDLTQTTVLRDLDEWSSLTALSIIAMLDEEYDVTIKNDDLQKIVTIEDLFNLVANK